MKTIFRVVQFKNKKYGVQEKNIKFIWPDCWAHWETWISRYESYKDAMDDIKKEKTRIDAREAEHQKHVDNEKIFKTFPVIK